MRFIVSVFGGDGRIWAIPYRQPVSGADFYRKAKELCPPMTHWMDLDYIGAALCFNDQLRHRKQTTALAFIAPADEVVIIEASRELDRKQRDYLAECLERIIKGLVDGQDLKEVAGLLAPPVDNRASLSGLGLSTRLLDAVGGRTGGGDARIDLTDNGAGGWYPDGPPNNGKPT